MKKRNFKLNILSLVAVVAVSYTSCDNDVDQDYAIIDSRPVATLTADKTSLLELDDASTAAVDESVANYTLTMSKPYNTNMKFKIELLSSSTADLDDFTISLDSSPIDQGSDGYLITVPKYETVINFSIAANFDILPEQSEKLNFRLIPAADLNGQVAANSQNFSLTIGNSTSDDLKVTFDWNSDGEYIGTDNTSHSLGDYDFDLEIYDTDFNVVDFSYGSAPEEVDFAASNPDGTYLIVPSFWTTTGPVAPALPITFTTKVTVSKPGVFVQEFNLPAIWNTTIGGAQQGNPDAYYIVGYFIKTTVGGEATYQLYDADDNLLVSGRFANIKSLLSSKSKKGKK